MNAKRSAPVEVYVEKNGKRYSGFYRTEGNLISVQYRDRSKKTQIGASPLETLARMMIAEMVEEESRERGGT
jgi:hypothetical protein